MQYIYSKKPLESIGTPFIVLTLLELEILYFKDGFLPNFYINFKSGPFIKVVYGLLGGAFRCGLYLNVPPPQTRSQLDTAFNQI